MVVIRETLRDDLHGLGSKEVRAAEGHEWFTKLRVRIKPIRFPTSLCTPTFLRGIRFGSENIRNQAQNH